MSQNKALQYIKLLEEYDQAESLYDTAVYIDPELQAQNKSALPPLEQSFSVDTSRKPTTSTARNSEVDAWNTVWNILESVIMRTPQEPKAHKPRIPQEQLSKTVPTTGSNSSQSPIMEKEESLAAKARKKRNPSPPKGKRVPTSPTKSQSRAKPRVDDIALLGSVYQAPTVETRQPASVNGTINTEDASSCLRTHPDNSSVRQLEPEATCSIQQETKELAAKKRAARAKKKGAIKKIPVPTQESPSHPHKPAPDTHMDTQPEPQQSHAKHYRKQADPRAGTPSKQRLINKEPPGIRKHVNDDASVAPLRTTRQFFAARPPKSIVRQDLEELEQKKHQKPAPWMALLAGGTMPTCAGTERSATPPPIRPCDLPRGPEIKKKNESANNIINKVAGEIFQALGL